MDRDRILNSNFRGGDLAKGVELDKVNRSSPLYRGHIPLMLIGPWILASNFCSKGPRAMKLGGRDVTDL